MNTQAETHEFRAEVSALLKLVTNSLYTNREIFLRELISNAADALDKARFQALVRDDLSDKELAPSITITVSPSSKTLVIEDTGIGMTRDEASQNLGTIAHSGTLKFLEAAKSEGKADVNLIGQFGVGFYSAFMVADKVVVQTRSALPGAEPVQWTSSGDGGYELSSINRDVRGTRIELQLKEDAAEFLERYRIQGIVRQYSNYVMHPIHLVVEGEETPESGPEQINAARAIWTRSPSDLSDEDYEEFYKHVMGGFVLPGDTPRARLHFSMDAPIQFSALLYVPGRAPMDLFAEDRKAVQLYARHVLVDDNTDKLLPPYLRFFRGVVDSEDLPLNVSREMLQENKNLSAIRRQLTRKAIKILTETATERAEDYEGLWKEFGSVLKEGLHMDGGHRDELIALTRWYTVNTEGLSSLADYVKAMPEDQPFIYFIAGEDAATLRTSPHLEALKSRGHDVLLMTDAVDEWVLQSMDDYEGKSFRNVMQGDLDKKAETSEEEGEDTPPAPSPIDPLLSAAKALLGDNVKEVKASTRLTNSAACLVDADGSMSRNMERILRLARQRVHDTPRVLELNPTHPLVERANELAKESPGDPRLETWVALLHDLASLAEGSIPDPSATVQRLQTALETVAEAERAG
ncbi:MAG: molecular chaperone HtpG [Nannocystaceae bacterium]